MMRIILASLLFIFLSTSASAKPTLNGRTIGDVLTIVFAISDSADSDPIEVLNVCSIRGTIISGDVVEVRSIASPTQAASTGDLIASYSSSPTTPTIFTSGTRYIKVRATASATGGSQLFINCSGSQVSMNLNTNGMVGGYATQSTISYLDGLKRFEGLDPSISWTTYWIDPYTGTDTNSGSYEYPIRTLGKMKTLARHGARFIVKNGNRVRPTYFSPQTFAFPTGKTCVPGEFVTYTGGTSTILDIDNLSGTIVFADRSGTSIAASTVVTTASQSGSACAFTVGAKRSGFWSGSTAACQNDAATSCTFANRYTSTGCTGSTCVAASESMIYLQSPTRYDGRITSYIDAENPNLPFHVHGNGLTMGELTNTQLGTNDDHTGLFIAGNNSAHGCFGVANAIVENLRDDVISQRQEGCVRALNVSVSHATNGTNSKNVNILSSQDGTSGRGGVVLVNGGGIVESIDETITGAPIFAAGSAHMVLIGSKDFLVDASNQSNANAPSVMTATGGQIVVVGHDFFCDVPATNGCNGITLTSADSSTSLSMINSSIRSAGPGNTGLSITTQSSNPFTLKLYKSIFNGGDTAARAIFTQANSGAISADIRGSVFQNEDFYWYDNTTNANNLSGTASGIYDEDTTNIFHFTNPGADYTTASAADAATPIDLFKSTDTYSLQTDVTEYQNNLSLSVRSWCLSTGRCYGSYTESLLVKFPVAVYDYLASPIMGYVESGTRNYGPK